MASLIPCSSGILNLETNFYHSCRLVPTKKEWQHHLHQIMLTSDRWAAANKLLSFDRDPLILTSPLFTRPQENEVDCRQMWHSMVRLLAPARQVHQLFWLARAEQCYADGSFWQTSSLFQIHHGQWNLATLAWAYVLMIVDAVHT